MASYDVATFFFFLALIDGYPRIDGVTATSVKLVVSLSEPGTVYVAISTDAESLAALSGGAWGWCRLHPFNPSRMLRKRLVGWFHILTR